MPPLAVPCRRPSRRGPRGGDSSSWLWRWRRCCFCCCWGSAPLCRPMRFQRLSGGWPRWPARCSRPGSSGPGAASSRARLWSWRAVRARTSPRMCSPRKGGAAPVQTPMPGRRPWKRAGAGHWRIRAGPGSSPVCCSGTSAGAALHCGSRLGFDQKCLVIPRLALSDPLPLASTRHPLCGGACLLEHHRQAGPACLPGPPLRPRWTRATARCLPGLPRCRPWTCSRS
mmetsp:Transcript_84845/g.243492  ORF Transcript_84845/g.243492 Transcript_84845/m.243492 type:complete len:227 (-) Transcript_84845:246-926(-)